MSPIRLDDWPTDPRSKYQFENLEIGESYWYSEAEYANVGQPGFVHQVHRFAAKLTLKLMSSRQINEGHSIRARTRKTEHDGVPGTAVQLYETKR